MQVLIQFELIYAEAGAGETFVFYEESCWLGETQQDHFPIKKMTRVRKYEKQSHYFLYKSCEEAVLKAIFRNDR